VTNRADLDGDGDLDWVLYVGDIVVDDIFADDPGITRLAHGTVGRDGKRFVAAQAIGDYNGDGVDDYVSGWHDTNSEYHRFAMVSAP
ncbi:MAG: hypothetical protein JKY37_32715, partial [Nannocystaceae bacterium]|nr:hypothetical protein [Nannocystaceae bacterium]